MTNFAFLPSEFDEIAESAKRAEGHIVTDPRAACFYARLTLENIVHWLYRFDPVLKMPYDDKLSSLIYEPCFRQLVGEVIMQKAKVIQKQGNRAVHEHRREVKVMDAGQVVKELHHICYWLCRTYTPEAPRDGASWKDERIPHPEQAEDTVPKAQLEKMAAELEERNQADLKKQKEQDALNDEIKQLRKQLEETRIHSMEVPDVHDYDEADTRSYLIDLELSRAGWPLDKPEDVEYEVKGMPNQQGKGYVDYVLWGNDGLPLAVVEAKRSTHDPDRGQQQAKLYADCLEQEFGLRPLIFYTNGYTHWFWDDSFYPPRQVSGFYQKDELERIIQMRGTRADLTQTAVNEDIAGRYYQKRAIRSICETFAKDHQRTSLLVMATGTGKTRTAIALVDALMRAGWVKRALFLADRVSLVNQATNAFKDNLPDSSPVNLVTEKDTSGRVYTCTYPTMMGLIEKVGEGDMRFGPGHFDLIIIDEAHRSVYQKYGAIFRYFDSLLVGLTATPADQVDRNTYELFGLEPGVPTDAYELQQAIADGYLVPPRVEKIDMKFPREGINYDELSDEEKAEWESLDWGDDAEDGVIPREVNASAVNNWLFNESTVDKMLKHLMEHGHHVNGGDRLAKTIIFARNHDHAVFIEQRFNHHYPHEAGKFARVIDNKAKYVQTLIEDFETVDKAPHIAISVDMLDTGIDIPDVANLVFFKPVYSRIKFMQMIGRGTRLRPELYGLKASEDDDSVDKQDFRIFDFCFNFDFFDENPEGIEPTSGVPLGTRIFRSRVSLLSKLQAAPDNDEEGKLTASLVDELHSDVSSMNRENFLVREQLQAVEKFSERENWNSLDDAAEHTLINQVAGLPAEQEPEKIETRLFDMTVLGMQLARIEGRQSDFEVRRRKMVEMASLLEEKTTIPDVVRQLGYLQQIQEMEFWQDITLPMLEEMRLRLRTLAPFLDKKKRTKVFTRFEDEVLSVREQAATYAPKMTGVQYEKKVKAYLKEHLNNIVIHRLRSNKPLTQTDLDNLQSTLEAIGDDEGQELFKNMLERHGYGANTLPVFIRTLVGMDQAAAKDAFSKYLNDKQLTSAQIRFIEMIIDQLTARGVMKPEALYEAPFTGLHSGGPDALFAGEGSVVDGLFDALAATQPKIVPNAG